MSSSILLNQCSCTCTEKDPWINYTEIEEIKDAYGSDVYISLKILWPISAIVLQLKIFYCNKKCCDATKNIVLQLIRLCCNQKDCDAMNTIVLKQNCLKLCL